MNAEKIAEASAALALIAAASSSAANSVVDFANASSLLKNERYTRGAAKEKKAAEIIQKSGYRYNFGDGWVAFISAEQVDSSKAAKLRKRSAGFMCYDWMIDSIIKNGEIKSR